MSQVKNISEYIDRISLPQLVTPTRWLSYSESESCEIPAGLSTLSSASSKPAFWISVPVVPPACNEVPICRGRQ